MSITTHAGGAFQPVEHAILSDWLELPRPTCTRDIELADYWEPAHIGAEDSSSRREAPAGGHVRLRRADPAGYSDTFDTLDNAVARLCLERVQERLPKWSTGHIDKEDTVTRRLDEPTARAVSLLPRLALEINWASNAPGFSWPEAYWLTFVPSYDVFVVTASRDSTEIHGFLDVAIAWFRADVDPQSGVEAILRDFWALHLDRWQQLPWEHVFFEGLVSSERAWELANEIWPEGDDTECMVDREYQTLCFGHGAVIEGPLDVRNGVRPLGSRGPGVCYSTTTL